jgi:hypothetical protein
LAFVFGVALSSFIDDAKWLRKRIRGHRRRGLKEVMVVPLAPAAQPSQHDYLLNVRRRLSV